MKSSKIKKWNVLCDHRPTSIIDQEKANKKRQEAKKKTMFTCFAISDLAIEVAKISVITGIKGINFKNPKMTNKLNKVEDLMKDIQKSELGQVVNLHPDYIEVMQNEHALEIFRWFELMAFYPTDHIRAFNDGIEIQNDLMSKGIVQDPYFTKEELMKAFEAGHPKSFDSFEDPIERFNEFYDELLKSKNA